MARTSGARKSATPRKGATAKPKAAAKKAAPKANKLSVAQRKRQEAERKERERIAAEMDLARDGLTEKPKAKPTRNAAATVERAETYLKVWSDWAGGMTYPAVAAKHKLSQRRVEQIVQELRGSRLNSLRLQDPLATAQDLILRWSHAVSQYAELADGITEQGQMHVKLGFLKRRDEALESMTTLMQELGYLPRHLGTLRVLEDWQGLIDTLLDGMDELGIPVDVQRQLVARVEVKVEQTRGGERLQIVQGSAEEVTSAAA